MPSRRVDESPTVARINEQTELQQVCALDVWAEIEGQLRVLTSALHEIAIVRARCGDDAAPLSMAEDLSRHVQTMKGWVKVLDATVAEADDTVEKLVLLLKAT